jgi:hypothetical protein
MGKNGAKEEESSFADVLNQLTIPLENLFYMLDDTGEDEKIAIAKIGFCILRDITEHIERFVEAMEKDLGKIKITVGSVPPSLHPQYLKARATRETGSK